MNKFFIFGLLFFLTACESIDVYTRPLKSTELKDHHPDALEIIPVSELTGTYFRNDLKDQVYGIKGPSGVFSFFRNSGKLIDYSREKQQVGLHISNLYRYKRRLLLEANVHTSPWGFPRYMLSEVFLFQNGIFIVPLQFDKERIVRGGKLNYSHLIEESYFTFFEAPKIFQVNNTNGFSDEMLSSMKETPSSLRYILMSGEKNSETTRRIQLFAAKWGITLQSVSCASELWGISYPQQWFAQKADSLLSETNGAPNRQSAGSEF